jgi:hypothetical protein
MLGVVWVDDFVFHKRVEWHPSCGGLAAGCPACGRGLAAAELLDEWWVGLNRQLGVSLNVKKHQRCAQSVEYAGFLFDTFRGLMRVTADKQAVLLEQAASLGLVGALWSARELDSIKGRLLHYSAAVRHLRVLVTEFQRLMGPVPEEEYDDIGPGPAGLVDLSAEMCGVLARYAPVGRPLWPPTSGPRETSHAPERDTLPGPPGIQLLPVISPAAGRLGHHRGIAPRGAGRAPQEPRRARRGAGHARRARRPRGDLVCR